MLGDRGYIHPSSGTQKFQLFPSTSVSHLLAAVLALKLQSTNRLKTVNILANFRVNFNEGNVSLKVLTKSSKQ